MKRSEAIKLIGKFLAFGPSGFSKKKQEAFKDMSLADMILTELEEAGMKPPKADISFLYGNESVSKYANKWELEND